MIPGLVAGDTLVLAPGEYPRLTIANLAGAPGRCVTITGPAGDRPAVIFGEIGNKTVEIIDSSYIVVTNLVIDGRGIPGAGAASRHPSHRSRRQPDHWRRRDPADRWHYDQDPDLEVDHPANYDPLSRHCALSRRFRRHRAVHRRIEREQSGHGPDRLRHADQAPDRASGAARHAGRSTSHHHQIQRVQEKRAPVT
jgi:hypothetical protein